MRDSLIKEKIAVFEVVAHILRLDHHLLLAHPALHTFDELLESEQVSGLLQGTRLIGTGVDEVAPTGLQARTLLGNLSKPAINPCQKHHSD